MADSTADGGGTKRCSHCKQEKSLAEFGMSSRLRDGRNIYCRTCKAEFNRRTRQRHAANPYVTHEPKRCCRCRRVRPAADFYLSRNEADGRCRQCKDCSRELRERNYAKNKSAPVLSEGTRVCSSCGVEKPLTAFSVDRNRKFGRSYYCRECLLPAKRAANERIRTARAMSLVEDSSAVKVCRSCEVEKPLSAFTPNLLTPDGRQNSCRDCRRPYLQESGKAWRQKNPEKWSLKNREQQHKRRLLKASASSGRVDLARILEQHGMTCHICGEEIMLARGTQPGSLTFDHVVPLSRGGMHSEENLRPAHHSCNSRKNDRPMSEVERARLPE